MLTKRGGLDSTEYYYYDGQKQIEMRDVNEDTLRQYVWGTQYIDEIVRVDMNHDSATDDDCLEAGSESYYYHQDANFNVVAITDMDGLAVSRTTYSSYGRPTFFDGVGHQRATPTFGPSGNTTHTSAVAWQGLHWDAETGHSYNRARSLHHRLGRFMQCDPVGYKFGMNVHEYLGSSPFTHLDPTGKGFWKCFGCQAACIAAATAAAAGAIVCTGGTGALFFEFSIGGAMVTGSFVVGAGIALADVCFTICSSDTVKACD